MNKRILNLILLFAFLFPCAGAYAQAVTMTTATGGLAGAAQIAGTNNIAILGVQLNKAAGGGNTVTSIVVGMTPTPVGKFTNARLYESADATFSGVGSETLITTGTIAATDITFTAAISNFDGATAAADDEYFFIVVDVDPNAAAAATTTPSLASTGVIVSTGTTSGTTITGATYTLTPPQTTITNLGTGLATSPLLPGATGQGVFGFSLTSTGSQTVTALNIQTTSTPIGKWGSYSLITSADNSFSTTGDNSAAIGGLTITPSAGQIAISGLSQTITTSATNYFLVVNVDPGAAGTITPSLAAANATATTGTFTGTATGTAYSFQPILTIANLSTGLAGSPLIASTTDQGVFGFSLTSNGSQTVTVINVQVTSTPASKWGNYRLITSTDASYATTGDNSAPIGGLTFTPTASQVGITGLSQAITSTGTNYFLVVDVDPAVTGLTTAVLPSLGAGNLTITTGGGIAAGSASGTNYSFGSPTATFAQLSTGIAASPLPAGIANQAVIGFSASSNSTQSFTAINIQLTSTPVSKWGSYSLVRSTDNSFTTAGDNTTIGSLTFTPSATQVAITGLTETLTGTAKNYFLVVTVDPGVIATTTAVQPSFAQANITAAGTVIVTGTTITGTNYAFNTSQLSDITFTGGSTSAFTYRTLQAASIDNTNLSLSQRIANFQVHDGGGPADGDNKATSITQLQIQVTNIENIRQIALFNDDTDTEVAGTEQTAPAVTGTTTITFTPASPLRTTGDGTDLNLMVRVTFDAIVFDNAPIEVTITSVTGEAGYSGFAAVDAGGANSTGATHKTIIVAASKFILSPPPLPNPSPKTTNFGLTIKAVDGNPLNNIDTDYNGKVDLTASGGPGTLTGGGQKTLASGQFVTSTLQIDQSGTYTLDVSDDDYTDAPDNQSDIGDASSSITITSSATGITPGTTTPATICYGTNFFPLSDIVLTETDAAGISGTGATVYTFSIALPSGFVFDQTVTNPGVGLLAGGVGAADITVTTGPQYSYPSANIVQFSYTFNGTAGLTTLSIRGLRVGRPHPGNTMPGNVKPPALAGLNITRSGGSAIVAGVAAGTNLGTLNISTPTTLPAFTVEELPGDVNVDPTTTNYNVNANSVKLVPGVTPPPGSNLFAGSGVTFVNPDYKFNPNSLSPGAYDITNTYTDGTGCQRAFVNTFTVYTSGIDNLALAYCNNDAVETGLDVNQTFINQRMAYYGFPANSWKLDYFVYYDPNIGDFRPITGTNNQFDPALPAYQTVVQYFGGQIPIGFAVCNPTNGYPCTCNPIAPGTCNPSSGNNYGVYDTYQWVTVNAAPSPTFTLPKTKFCLDDPAVVLSGTPPNSDLTGKDFFFATEIAPPYDPFTISPVTVSSPPTSKVWSFNPATLGVGTAYIRYTYENPATGCSGTSDTIRVTVYNRPAKVDPVAITSLGGVAPETCQGAPIGTFTASPLTTPSKYTWYSNSGLTTVVGTGNSFAPPNPPVDPNTPTPGGSPHTFYVTQTVDGCESNKELVGALPALSLTVTIKPAPAAPTPNFADLGREFCVGATITPLTLVVPGTGVKWYKPATSTIEFIGTSPPIQDSLSIPNPTVAPAVYDYEVTQTVSLCESPRTPVRVKIKGLPILSVSSGASDPLKICTEGGHTSTSPPGTGTGTLITFSGSDENGPIVAGTSSWTTAPSTPTFTAGALIDSGPTAFLNTPTLIPNDYTLRFTHTNTASCSNFIDVPLTVLPKIIPSLFPLDSCFENFVRLKNYSQIQTGPALADTVTSADIVSISWDFKDGDDLAAGNGSILSTNNNNGRTRGTYLSPEHNFLTLGSKSVTYKMNTTYCSYAGTELITIHPKPQVNFTWSKPCYDSLTEQSATRFIASEASSIPIAQYYWDFNVNGNIDHSGTPGGGTPIVNYIEVGTDSVELIVRTAAQCRDTIQKIVYILPTYKAITDTSGYDQNFNAGNNFWIQGGIRSSWQLGSTMAGTASNGAAWATGLTGPSNAGEQSWVMSGCFNFSDAIKPVVSLDTWSDTPFGVDGTVFQFNDDGAIENEASWIVLGDPTSGINWYDGSGISNSPGNQTTSDYGWTGTYPDWRKSIYKLDAVKPATPTSADSLIIFRVAFGGANVIKSGFAFDNVFIGERSRVVLLESFTNTNPTIPSDTIAINAHNKEYEQFGDVSTGELVKIQYHTPFPGNDVLNSENQSMNNSRAAFYGITESPAGRVDGGYENGALPTWLNSYNDDRVLTPSIIRLDSTIVKKTGTDVKIKVKIENTSSQALSLDGINAFVVVVQKEILRNTGTEDLFGTIDNPKFVYVARQMLPSAAGTPLSGKLAGGQSLALDSITWSHPNGGDAIVVFLQRIDGENKPVLQAFLLENPPVPTVITGTEDPEYAKHISLYPNPANNELHIELPGAVNKPTPVALSDAYGRVVYQSSFRAGERAMRVSTSTFANGIYMMQIITPQGNKVTRKVMVKH